MHIQYHVRDCDEEGGRVFYNNKEPLRGGCAAQDTAWLATSTIVRYWECVKHDKKFHLS